MTIMLTVTVIVIMTLSSVSSSSKGYAQLPITILSVLAAALVSYGAAYGGSLVYEYQFNVESLEGSTVWDETEIDQMPGKKGHPQHRLKT